MPQCSSSSFMTRAVTSIYLYVGSGLRIKGKYACMEKFEVSFIDVYVDCNFWLGLTINNVVLGLL